MDKYCCFVLYDNFEFSEEAKDRLRVLLEKLIVNHSVNKFLFYFYNRATVECLNIICELKNKYAGISSVKANFRSSKSFNKSMLIDFDEIINYTTRNEFAVEELIAKMINSSEYVCLCYDRKNNEFLTANLYRKLNRSLYYYALEKNKLVYNLCTNQIESFMV